MDLAGQLASVWRRRVAVLGGALAVGLVVLVVRLLTPPVYAAVETVRVDVRGVAESSEAVAFAAQTVTGLAGTDALLADAAGRSGLAVGVADVAERTTVAEGGTTGFLTISSDGPSPEEADALARAVTDALDARLVADNRTAVERATAPLRDQLAALEQELGALPPGSIARTGTEQRYSALVGAVTEIESRPGPSLILGPPAAAPTDPVSPVPVRDALLAFVVALVLLAEGVVLVRAARGRLSEADPAARVARELDLPTVVLDATADVETALASLYRERLRGARTVVVVQLGARDGTVDLGGALGAAARLVDGPGPADGSGSPPEPSGGPVVRSVRRPELDRTALGEVGRVPGPVLLAVDTATARAPRLAPDVAALRAVGADVVAVLVWRGRFPRVRDAGGGPRAAVGVRVPEAVESTP